VLSSWNFSGIYANTCGIGYTDSGKFQYRDASGFDLDTQVLVFKVKLPKGSDPL
jgi:hypothetical protein